MMRTMTAMTVRKKKPKPLESFNAQLIQPKLKGLFRNIDQDLLRKIREVEQRRDEESQRQITLLSIMMRITKNTYEAVCFLVLTCRPTLQESPHSFWLFRPSTAN